MKGSFEGLAANLRDFAGTAELTATPLQQEVIARVKSAHVEANDLGLYSLNPLSAFGRLVHAPSAGPYEASARDVFGVPCRGEVVTLSSGLAALPPAGSTPTPLADVSPQARYYLENFSNKMLKPRGEVCPEEVSKVKAYMDPTLRSKKAMVKFAADLWESGMLGFAETCAAEIKVFFVFKRADEQGRWMLRPVWDLRGTNVYFQKPPGISLGSPGHMAELDLSEEVVEGKKLHSVYGDLPDYFHHCETPPCMWPFFVLGKVSPTDLAKELLKRSVRLRVPAWARYVAVRVAPMGFSWAPFLCHSALEDMLIDRCEGFPRTGQLAMGRPIPSFCKEAHIFWVYMDDYLTSTLRDDVPETKEELEKLRQKIGTHFAKHGFDTHKDGVAKGVDISLGMTIDTSSGHRLKAAAEKLALIIAGTRGLLDRGRCSSLQLSRLVGVWIWIMSGVRPALCMFDAVFKFIEAHRESKQEHMLWSSVRDELVAVWACAPLMSMNLSAPWSEKVFASDASMEGYGIVSAKATLEDIRAEAARTWSKEDVEAVGGPAAGDLDRLPEETRRLAERGLPTPTDEEDHTPQQVFGDIFSGEGGFGAAASRALGVGTVFLDTAIHDSHNLLVKANLQRMIDLIAVGYFFALHFAPPCSTWSRARLPRLRQIGKFIKGLPGLKPSQVAKLQEGTALMDACIEMVVTCLENGVPFSLENPLGSMVWSYPPMVQILRHPLVFVVDLVYCSYGMAWKKPTRIITSISSLTRLRTTCSGDHVHQTLRGTAPNGVLWTRLACAYPQQLCEAFGRALSAAFHNGVIEIGTYDIELVAEIFAGTSKQKKRKCKKNPHVKPVSDCWADPSRWSLAWKGLWGYEEHINVQELRTVSLLSKHLGRASTNWDKKHLLMLDSLVSLGAIRKMRSGSAPLLRQLRTIGMCQLALGVRLIPRWIPSAMNPADGPSRGLSVGAAPETIEKHAPKETTTSMQTCSFAPQRFAPEAVYTKASHL